MFKKIQQARQILSVSMLLFSAVVFTYTNQFAAVKLAFQFWDPFAISHYRLSMLTNEDFIKEVQNALDEGDIVEAQNLVSLANDYGHQIPPELEEKTQESYIGAGFRYTTGFASGFIYGEIISLPTLLGTVASDYIGIGDLRDLSIEGMKFINNEDHDVMTLGISAIGVTTSGIALSSWLASSTGVAAPASIPLALAATEADKGASLIKAAYKTRKLSKPLLDKITTISAKLINRTALTKALKSPEPLYKMPSLSKLTKAAKDIDFKKMIQGDFTSSDKVLRESNPVDIKMLNSRFSDILNKDVASEMTDLVKGTGELLATGGVFTSLRALNYADDVKDIKKISKLSSKFKQKTSSVLKVLGKKAFKLGKLIYYLLSVFISLVIWCLWAAWAAYSIATAIRRMLTGKKKRVSHGVQ